MIKSLPYKIVHVVDDEVTGVEKEGLCGLSSTALSAPLDHTLAPPLSSRSRELAVNVRLPLPPVIGVSRFATQTIG
jgi:hypothetical protein